MNCLNYLKTVIVEYTTSHKACRLDSSAREQGTRCCSSDLAYWVTSAVSRPKYRCAPRGGRSVLRLVHLRVAELGWRCQVARERGSAGTLCLQPRPCIENSC
jgi:hypothetical protein